MEKKVVRTKLMSKCKKRLAKILAMALVITGSICYVPQTAEEVQAADPYPIWIGTTRLASDQSEINLNSGKVKFTPGSYGGADTLEFVSLGTGVNYTYTDTENNSGIRGAIYYNGSNTLKIICNSDTTVKATAIDGFFGIYSEGPIIIEGNGSLTVEGGSGIGSTNIIAIKLGSVKASGGTNGVGMSCTMINTISSNSIIESDNDTKWSIVANGGTSTKRYVRISQLTPLTVTVKDQTYIYNGYQQGEGDPLYNDPKVIKEKITVSGLKSGHMVGDIQLNGQGTNVGEYPIDLGSINIVDSAGENVNYQYDITSVSGKLFITSATHTVKFTDGIGNTLKTETVADGGSATAPKAPTRDDYEFTGWDKDFSKITSDLTVNALWKEKQKPTPPAPPEPVKVTELTLTAPKSTLECGETMSLSALVKPDNATDKTLIWSSSNTKAATVSNTGIVTAKGGGSTIITATAADGSGVKSSVKIKVKEYKDIKRIYILPTRVTIKVGKKKTLKAIVLPTKAKNKRIIWSVKNSKILSITENGKITALKKGTTYVTATTADGNKKKKIKVTVKK